MAKKDLYLLLGLGIIILIDAWMFFHLQNGAELKPFILKSLGPEGVEQFASKDWWRYLLPQAELTGSYTSTSLVLFFWLERLFGGTGNAYVIVHSLQILLVAGIAQSLWRSPLATLTAAFCVAFSTHNYHMFQITGSAALPLIEIFCVLTMYSQYRMIESAKPKWIFAFIASLILFAISYEGWIDYIAWLLVSGPLIAIYLMRTQRQASAKRLALSIVGVCFAFVVYLYVKVTQGYGQHSGTESDLVLNYHAFWPMFENVTGNLFKNLFLATTNFLPSIFGNSMSLQLYGEKWLIEQQSGYHPEFSHLAYMDALFYWRFFAGAAGALFLLYFFKALFKLWQRQDDRKFAMAFFASMIVFAGTSHALVKFRPFNSVPFLGYHVWFGILGVTGILAYTQLWINRRAWGANTKKLWSIGILLVILVSAFERPHFLNNAAKQFKMGKYPLPALNLKLQMSPTVEGPDNPK